jgi:hypothetical protein
MNRNDVRERTPALWALTIVFLLLLGLPVLADQAWSISVKGVRNEVLESTLFEQAKAHGSHYVKMRLERKGVMKTYSGMPLILIAAMADGTDADHPYRVDRSRWSSGYEITISARDGYSATFNTAEVAADAVILADREDGKTIPPTIVGNLPTSAWVKDVVEIELSLGAAESGDQAFKLILDINGKITSYTIAELEASRHYVEQRGSYTTSAGTTYTHRYGGVKFADLLEQFMHLEDDDTITLVAMDGYEMTYSGSQIRDNADGDWILAFKSDGEYLPEDPGFIRTVKVGPKTPNITGHLSVRMIEKIVVKEEGYRDFALAINGKMSFTLDRQTIQSGVSCHKKTVFFERKGTAARYTGIPLWRMLAYSDDPRHAPHRQDSSIISYRKELAAKGYRVEVIAADGFKITMDSREIDGNDDLILGMYREEEELQANEWPLVLVWDKNASVVPKDAKPIRQITTINLIFD